MNSFPHLLVRTITAFFGIALFVIILVLDVTPLTAGFFSLIAGFAAWEATGILAPGAGIAPGLLSMILTISSTAAVAVCAPYLPAILLVPGAVLSIFWLFASGKTEARIRMTGGFGLYALIAAGFGLLARHSICSDNIFVIFIPLLICWVGDSAAYFVGSAAGRHKLIPGVSPAKTREGLAAGIAGAVAGALAAGYFLAGLPFWLMVLTGAAGGIAAVIGDLFESALKRDAGLKDSGNMLPGHGGVLDRFDSLIWVAPVTWLILVVFGYLGR